MAINTIDTVTSILTQKELDTFCSTFNIPANLRPELPGRNHTIKDSPEGKIGIYTRFIEFANFCIPLSKFLLCVLEYCQINFSQLSVIAAAKINHFEIFEGLSVKRDPLLSDDVVNLPLLEWFNEIRAPIRKYPEVFLSVIGLSRSFIDDDVYPTFLEMGLLDFVKSSPFKVKIGDKTLAENEVPLSKETEDRVISPSREIVHLAGHTITNELQNVA
ncbi:hypothetical protein Tco_1398709, partial [Tanacetum coccineum]